MSTMYVNRVQELNVGSGVQIPGLYAPGHVIQVVQRITTQHFTISSASWTATDSYASITPKSSSSKILVQMTGVIRAYNTGGNNAQGAWRLYRDIGGAGFNRVGTHQMTHRAYDYGGSGLINDIPFHIQYLDSPATTSEITYKLYGSKEAGSNIEILPDGDDEGYITLMEIAQ